MSTDFSGVTFQQQKISPSDDGLIRRKLLADGILYGCDMSYSGTTLTMAAGQLMICGRQIRHPAAQNWAVVDATSGYARLVLTVDLTRTSTKDTFDQVLDTIEYASSLDGFTALETSNINISGTRYQVVLCVVSLGTGGITGITDKLQSIEAAGGGGLNLRVFGSTSAPQNPKENDIWLQTSVPINGTEIFPITPTWANAEGHVYIQNIPATGGDLPNFNVTKTVGSAKDIYLWLQLSGAVQQISGTWVRLNGWIYHGSQWYQFSAAFSARINVVYPAGSTCTISNGTKTYTAPSTGGYWECDVDSAGTWTVTATNGPQSASQSVSITASGQTAGVTLSYTLYLYKAGDWREAVTGGWTAYAKSATSGDGQASMPAVTYNSDNVVVSVQSQYGYPAGMYCTNKKVDLTKYSTLKLDGLCSVDRTYITVWSAIGNYTHDNIVAGVQFTNRSRGTVTLDISSLSGEFYVGFRFLGSQASPAMTMYNLYAE